MWRSRGFPRLAFVAMLLLFFAATHPFASSNAFARRDREQQDEQQLETKETKLNSLLEKIKPSATHTADGLPSLPVYEDPLTGEQTIMLHPATILNGKHVGYSKKRILEEIGRKEQFWGGQTLARDGFDSLSVFGAENKMKPISNGEGEEGDEENEKARKQFTLLEFVDARAGKKKATGDAEKDEDVSLVDEQEEDDILGGRRVAVFNVDMSTGIGKAFEDSGIFAKIKTLESQKKKKDLDAIRMSVNEILETMKKSLIVEQMNEQERATYNHMAFMTAGSGDESDKQFRDEDARDHQRNRGKKVTSMEEIRESNKYGYMTFRSGQGKQSVRAEFYNSMESHVELSWLDFDGNEVKYADLAPGASTTLSTFTKHKWLAKNYIGDPICLFVVDDRYPTLKKQYFEISEEEHEEVTLVMEENESSEAHIKRRELKKKFSLSNTPQTVGELTQEEKDELVKVAKERIRQILAKEKNEDLNIEMEDVHVFESTQDIVDFFEKRGTDKWKAKGGGGGGGGEKGEDGEDQNVVWLSEEQFRELGMPDNAKIKPARDAVDALVEEEILEEEAVQDVLREKNEEKQGEGERHKTKLREEL